MFYAEYEATGERVSAETAIRGCSMRCPCCKSEVVLKRGTMNAAHFAHKSAAHCDMFYQASNVMSEWHRSWQAAFPEDTREVVVTDKSGEKHIADICTNGYIIEFQHSPMTSEVFMERTKFYVRSGYKLIWVFDFIDECAQGIISEYETNKWRWKNAKKTFSAFNPQFDYWKSNVELMFETDGHQLRRITWCPKAQIPKGKGCPTCGADIQAAFHARSSECPSCGARIKKANSQLMDYRRFCTYDGGALNKQAFVKSVTD